MASKQFKWCVDPCPHYIMGGDTHKHTSFVFTAWEWSMHGQLLRELPVYTLSRCRSECSAPTWSCLMRPARLALPVARVPCPRRQRSVCCHGDHKCDPNAEARSVASSAQDEGMVLELSASPCRGLPFFPDLHNELCRSWNRPFFSKISTSSVTEYSVIQGARENSYGMMPWAEETLRCP